MGADILIIDDEADIRQQIGGILQDEGYATREANSSESAMAALRARQPNLILLDVWLEGSGMDGLQLLQHIRQNHPLIPVVMISGHGTIETAVTAIKHGAYDFIEKPFKADRLLLVIQRGLESARLKRENQELRFRAGADMELLGGSSVMTQLRHAIDKVAPTGSRVFITGGPGTGKELVARMIHAKSRRAQAPFVIFNCANIASDRLEIELFGSEASAGVPRKIGLLEQAHGGTLLLDEVGDMSMETQGKLVRTLQDQTFERIGGGRVEVDVRVIATTNHDIQQLMQNGRFRQDLFYRLNVVPLRAPPLIERREDIALLAKYFLQRAAETAGLSPRILADDAIAALQAYDWPGNVRQLRNVIDWVLIMAAGDGRDSIRAEMLPSEIGSIVPAVLRWEKGAEIMSMPLREAREMFEREYLMEQVTRFGGNISRTASFIGMERSALHRKLKMLGVPGGERGMGAAEAAE
ncbi:MAG: sigma-54-dependent transcriptional regulator [Alphaproteobacteria bacterium]